MSLLTRGSYLKGLSCITRTAEMGTYHSDYARKRRWAHIMCMACISGGGTHLLLMNAFGVRRAYTCKAHSAHVRARVSARIVCALALLPQHVLVAAQHG